MRIRLWLHLLFVLFAVFLTLLNSLATQTEAALMKSVRPADSSSATTTTIEESILRSGGAIGLSGECPGQAKVFHVHPIGIPKLNCRIFAKIGRTLAAKSTEEAAETLWKIGGHKSATKWANQMTKRGWTGQQITEAIQGGQKFPAPNMVNPANSATRFVHPQTGQSVVIDNVTKELL